MMPQPHCIPVHGLEARILPLQAGVYPRLEKDLWYHVRPDTCWLVGYGIKERVSVVDFEFRRLG